MDIAVIILLVLFGIYFISLLISIFRDIINRDDNDDDDGGYDPHMGGGL